MSVPETSISGTVTVTVVGDAMSFMGTATSSRGTGRVFSYDSITDTFVSN
jgi:hypothetical protein